MSQHSSLKSSGIKVRSNVLKRFERVAILKQQGRWKEAQRVTNLPKTKPPA